MQPHHIPPTPLPQSPRHLAISQQQPPPDPAAPSLRKSNHPGQPAQHIQEPALYVHPSSHGSHHPSHPHSLTHSLPKERREEKEKPLTPFQCTACKPAHPCPRHKVCKTKQPPSARSHARVPVLVLVLHRHHRPHPPAHPVTQLDALPRPHHRRALAPPTPGLDPALPPPGPRHHPPRPGGLRARLPRQLGGRRRPLPRQPRGTFPAVIYVRKKTNSLQPLYTFVRAQVPPPGRAN